MPYSNFKTLSDITQKFEITIISADSLFKETPEVNTSPALLAILEENVPLALNINTEKARSELIIAPVIVEIRRLLQKKVSLFSGIDFSVDEARDLNGFCDFLLSYSSNQAFLQVPVVCLVEAKNDNMKSGYAQCMAEMIAAQIYNIQQGHPVNWIFGVVTTGSNWRFLKLEDQQICIDFDEYLISQINKILGILVAAIHQISLLRT
ncbi:conserved hypothetical protein [Gammaproteobacteria bacterium]